MSEDSPKRIAFLVNALTGEELRAVKRDVSTVHSILTNPEQGGCRTDGPAPIHECKSKANFQEELSNVLDNWELQDQLVFYFAGHGDIRKNNQYCLKMGLKNTDWYPFNNLMGELSAAGVERAIIIIDACHSGAVIPGTRNLSGSINIKKSIESQKIPKGIAIITSSEKAQESHELLDGSSGVFTGLFCNAIQTSLGEQGTNDGYIYVKQIVEYINKKLQTHEKYSKFKDKQRPLFYVDQVEAEEKIWVAKCQKTEDCTQSSVKSSHSVRTPEELKILYEKTHPNRHPSPEATIEDIDLKLLEKYADEVEPDLYKKANLEEVLSKLKLYSPIQDGSRNVLHKSAVLCFHKRPEMIYPQARSVFVFGRPRESNFVRQDILGPLSFQVEALLERVKKYSESISYIGEDGLRKEVEEIDIQVARELISNAIAHRDYQLTGTVKVTLTPEELEIYSPGRFSPGLSWEQLIDDIASASNPVDEAISWYLLKLLVFEGIGRGFDVFKEYIKENGVDSIICRELQGPTIYIRVLRRTNRTIIQSNNNIVNLYNELHHGEAKPQMGEVYPLDRVIKKVDRSRANAQEGRLVMIDRSTGKEKRSLFARDIEYFIVANTKNDRNYADNSFEHQVKDFETELNLGFTINYQVSCEPGKEVQVAEALWNNTHPGAELERRIKKYISDFFNYEEEVASIIQDSSEVIKKLGQFVTDKVYKDIGLNIRLRISLGQENDLGNSNIRLISPHFPVMFKDYPEELDLKFELELSVSDSGGVILDSMQTDKLQKTVQSEIKKYLFENSSAEEFFGELDTTLRQKITWHLNNVLSSWGRQVMRLFLKSEVMLASVEPLFETDYEVFCRIQNKQVTIKNHVVMTPENIEKFRVNGSPNLKIWVEKNLDLVVKSALFEENYASVLVNFSPIEKKIKAEMVEQAKTIGYSIKHLTSIPDQLLEPIEPFCEIDHEVSCHAQEESVTIKNHVLMTPENIEKYIMQGSPNIKDWVKENLDKIIKSVLFSKKYLDVLVNFSPIEKEIKDAIVEQAEAIGYAVKHIASVPDMEPLTLTKDFSLQVKDENFETKASQVMVGLDIIVDAKIDDLKKIEGLISSRVDVKSEMQKAVERATRAFLHTVEPERFYMRFEHTDYEHPEEQFSLEEEIENCVKQALEGEPFYANVRSVTTKFLETEITRRYKKLQGEGKICQFEFEVISLKGGEPVKFQGDLQVERVHKNMWLVFQSRQYELEQIKSSFEKHMKAKLATKSQRILQYQEEKDRNALEYLLNKWGNDYIIDQFGLEISIKNVSRKLTDRDGIKNEKYKLGVELERVKLQQTERNILAPFKESQREFEFSEGVRAQLNQATKSKLSDLLKRRNALALGTGNEEEIKKMDNEIHDIENMANSSSLRIMDEGLNLLELESSVSDEGSFSEIAENEGLFAGEKEPKRLQEGE